MIIHHDEDLYESVYSHRTCPFHERNPGKTYAGCGCSSSWGQRLRSPEEVAAIKARRQREREDGILAEADAIRARRAGA